ncbi:MAG: EVE domain-containing protein [Candidatus Kapabacteria bacterium]|nr:EVE domain-containing protein [Candidatus Kapabacteria bacterium]
MKYWLVKSEPDVYSWDQLVADGSTFWDGVRNYAARNNLRDMKVGDKLLYYHSGDEKQIVGLAEVIKESYQDPTTDEDAWVCVDVKPVKKYSKPLTLKTIKQTESLKDIALIKLMRLSVVPILPEEFAIIESMVE